MAILGTDRSGTGPGVSTCSTPRPRPLPAPLRRRLSSARGLLFALLLAVAAPPPAAGGADPSWERQVVSAIAASEFEFRCASSESCSAPNRAHGFRSRVDPRGLEVSSRVDDGALYRFRLELLSITCEERETPPIAIGPGAVAAAGTRVTIDRPAPALSEWFVNAADGLEHGVTLARPPCREAGRWTLHAALSGTVLAAPGGDRKSITLRDATGRPIARYGALAASDSQGRDVAVEIDLAPGEVLFHVDDREATYPLTIDPLLTSAAWSANGGQLSAQLGVAVTAAGDVDGNGFSDLLAAAPLYDNGQADEGRAFVYLGSAGGLATTAAWSTESNQAGAQLGAAVAAAGDVNGDGYGDVAIGVPYYDDTLADEGRALVFLGSAAGLAAAPATTLAGGQAGAQFGASVARAGDVNGDGFDDVVVGAPLRDNGETDEGRAALFAGSAGGVSTTASWTFEPNQANARLGGSVAAAGDVNADGFADVIVGAPLFDNGQTDEGRAFVFHGSAGGLSTTAAWTSESDQAGAEYARSVAAAGDVNGDGFADVVVAAPLYDNGQTDEGRVVAFHGSATGLATTSAWSAESDQANAELGRALATAGDVNGDGFADVIAGAPLYDNGQTDEGRAFVYQGSSTGLATSPAWSVESDQAGAELGRAASAVGDVNGDGFGDVVVGLPRYDGSAVDEGRVVVYHGSGDGVAATASWTAKSNQPGAYFGYSVASAGDVNGDGYGDVLVGAYLYDGGQTDEGRAYLYLGSPTGLATTAAWTAESDLAGAHFSVGLAGAGDVNGDGYDDVAVGAPYYSGPEFQEGRAYVYFGSAGGLSASPGWIGQNNQADSRFGVSVAGAGDVNGDGFGDLVVGALFFDNGQTDEGRAYLYLGSSQGPGAAPSWTSEGNQPAASYAFSVAGAGDVNGDGYADVAVGSRLYSNGQRSEGRAFVFHGSATGLPASANWTAEPNLANANMGTSIAAAGDVNGDGFGDLLVGAPGYSNGQSSEGRAYLYTGSASGLASVPSWTYESNQAGGLSGRSVSGAGDVNGDGFDDLVVGAPGYDNGQADEGRADIFLGSAAGPAAVPALSIEPNVAGASLGLGVAGAGDVNGDGFGDVLLGAYLLSNPNTNEGKTFLHYGGGGDGLDRAPRQFRVAGTAPIGLYAKSDSATSFKLRALGRTPAGRGAVRLETELEPQGTAFDGSGLSRSTFRDTGVPGSSGSVYAGFDETIPGLGGFLSHWQVRLATKDPSFPRSPWLTHFENPRTRGDLRSNACTSATFYADGDGDGYGNAVVSQVACDQPAGYVRIAGDCDDANGQVSSAPGPVQTLMIASDKQTIRWLAPGDLGGQPAALRYDTLRATAPNAFGASATCVESNDAADTQALDLAQPASGSAWYYLARAENACPAGTGSLGTDSAGAPRTGRNCP